MKIYAFRKMSTSLLTFAKRSLGAKIGLIAFLLLSMGVNTSIVNAQTYDLNPQSWFPLEVGSYWHYFLDQGTGLDVHVVRKADRDTVVAGQRWVRIRNVHCSRTTNCSTETIIWYHYTPDNYLLLTADPEPNIAFADTLLPTHPRSFFSVDTSQEILESYRVESPVTVLIEEVDSGNEADSTNLQLRVAASNNIFFRDHFIYNIGRAEDLIGAIVGDVSYGDTTLITSVALSSENPAHANVFNLHLFPNPMPAHGSASVQLTVPKSGHYKLMLYDLLGRLLHQTERWLLIQEEWSVELLNEGSYASGVYFISLEYEGTHVTTRSLVVIGH